MEGTLDPPVGVYYFSFLFINGPAKVKIPITIIGVYSLPNSSFLRTESKIPMTVRTAMPDQNLYHEVGR